VGEGGARFTLISHSRCYKVVLLRDLWLVPRHVALQSEQLFELQERLNALTTQCDTLEAMLPAAPELRVRVASRLTTT
jgi:hypothetical protein